MVITAVTCNHESVHINKSFTCTSEGVFCAINCLKRGELYIGETGRMPIDRFREHLVYIHKKNDNELSLHFNSPGHSIYDVADSGLFFESESNRRRFVESEITRLGTLGPQVWIALTINIMSLTCFILYAYVYCARRVHFWRDILYILHKKWCLMHFGTRGVYFGGMDGHFLSSIFPVVCCYLCPNFMPMVSKAFIFVLYLHIYRYIIVIFTYSNCPILSKIIL